MRLRTIKTVVLLAVSIFAASSVAHAQQSEKIQRIAAAPALVPNARGAGAVSNSPPIVSRNSGIRQRVSQRRVVPPPPRPGSGGFFPPPQPPACPPVPPGSGDNFIVSISDGNTISLEDVLEFNIKWMSPDGQVKDGCQVALNFAVDGLSKRGARWDTAERMRAMARMHELTYGFWRDLRYLNHLRELIEISLFFRDDHYPGNPDPNCQRCEPTPIDDFRGGHVAGWGGVQFDNLSGISEDVTGIFTYPIATFARIVAEDPSLQADYGPDALRYANAAMETMLSLMPQMNFQTVGNVVEGYLASPDSYATKLTPQVCGNDTVCREYHDSAGLPLEYNGNAEFMIALIELWRALDSPYYQSHAPPEGEWVVARTLIPLLVSRFQRFWDRNLRVGMDDLGRGNYFVWNYSDGSPHSIHAEDTAHGSMDMLYLDVLRRNFDQLNNVAAPVGEPIQSLALPVFANTFLLNIAQPYFNGSTWTPGSSNFARDVYGDDPGDPGDKYNGNCDDWVGLAAVAPDVYDICREVTLRVVIGSPNGVQPNLTIGGHSALLMNKQFSRVAGPPPPPPPNCTTTGCQGGLMCCDCISTNIRCTTKRQCDASCGR